MKETRMRRLVVTRKLEGIKDEKRVRKISQVWNLTFLDQELNISQEGEGGEY